MAFKSYLQLSLPITIQHGNTYSATETKTLEAIAAIWRVLTSIDSESVILAWYPKVGETLRPLKPMDCMKILTKNAVNDKYIKLILIGWFARSTIIRFRLGYNLSIDAILEDPHFSYTLDNYEADLTREKIKSTETAITVWLGGGIPKQSILESIEQFLLEPMEFQHLDIDQVQLIMKTIILKPGK